MVDYGTNYMEKYDRWEMERYVKEQIDKHETRATYYGKLWTVLSLLLLFILLTPVYIKLFL